MRQLCAITINSIACLFPQAEDVREQDGASAEHVAHQFAWRLSNGLRLRNRQSTCQSDQSITKNTVSALLCGSQQLGERNVDSFPTEGASATICTALAGSHFPPSTQPFTSGSYRAIEHSPGTSTSPTSATKSILKQHSPQFPHYFTCQTLTKQSRKAKCSSGAPQHTSCQPRPH